MNMDDNNTMMVKLTTNDGQAKVQCSICNLTIASLNAYMRHIKKHEYPGGFLCRYCPAKFCLDDDLKKHREENHVTIVCRICKDSITFSNEQEYRDHIRDIHNGVDREIYACDKCGAQYKTLEPYRRHIKNACGTQKPFKCDQCTLSFVTKYNLKQHKESHTGKSKFCCSYCGKKFLQKGRLVEHERSHTGEKPYKCEVCGKSFAHRESIVTHSTIHTGVRLVECKCCQSRFSCYSNLLKHRRTRPQTCGRPEYDPPKHRIRAHVSRIPAAINPSEIKVSNVNKIIKKELVQKLDEENAKRKSPVTRKRSSIKQSKKSNEIIELVRTHLEDVFNPIVNDNSLSISTDSGQVDDEDDDAFLLEAINDNDNNNDDNDTIDTLDTTEKSSLEEQFDNLEMPLNVKLEAISESDPFDVIRQLCSPTDVTFLDIKTELNAIDFEKRKQQTTSLNDIKKEILDVNTLNETEIIVLNDKCTDPNISEESNIDMLDIQQSNSSSPKIGKCKVKLQDIIKSKSKKTEVNRKESKIHGKKRGQYRKRGEENGEIKRKSSRMAKISQNELRERLKSKPMKTWNCPYCIKIYHIRKPFEKHLRDDHQCNDEEITELFKNDNDDKLNDDVFKCHICHKIYLMEKRLLSHIKLHGVDGKLTQKCPCYCNLYFATKQEAQEHAIQDHRDLLYCMPCEKLFKFHDSLKNHQRRHHNMNIIENDKPKPKKERNFICDKCGKKFSGRTTLSDHERSDCGRKPIYGCNVCGKQLTTAGTLKTHSLLHKEETPYECDKCGKKFKVKAQYKTHTKIMHTNYKPFKCHLCPKEYPYRESLLIHMTVHTGIKRFLCNGCGKRFTCISNLQAHRKVNAESCGQLPLNAKATQYMGVQKGNLLLGAKPEAGFDYLTSNTLFAKDVISHDQPIIAQEINLPSKPSAPMATVPLNLLSQTTITQMINDSHKFTTIDTIK